MVKNVPSNAGEMRHGFDPCVGKIPWRRAWQPTLVFLPGESLGQRSLVGYGPQGCTELYMTEATEQTRIQKAMKVKKQGNYLQKKLERDKKKGNVL